MTNRTAISVPDKVRGLAAERRLTQSDLAGALHLSRMAIVRRMNGTVKFNADELLTLSEFLDVPVGAFFGEVGDAA